MKKAIVIAAVSSCLIPAILPPPVVAATSAEIATAIKDAKILDVKQELIVAVNGRETIVSTYENTSAHDKAAVCKFDALLVAKQVLETQPNTLVVSVQFYRKDRKHFRKVTITASELERFSSGSLTQDQLLDSLQVVEHAEAPPRNASIASVVAVPKNPNYMLFRYGGLSYYFPKEYSVSAPADPATSQALSRATADHLFSVLGKYKSMPANRLMYQIFLKLFSSPGSFVCMSRPGSSARIMLTVRAGSINECVAEAKMMEIAINRMAGSKYTGISNKGWVNLGYGDRVKAYECGVDMYKSKINYLYFGDSVRTCVLGVSSFDQDFAGARREFDVILRSLQYVP